MSITKLEIRIATLERKIADIADKVDSAPSQDINAWIDQIHGTFQNDAAYREAAKLGREWRKGNHLPVVVRSRKSPAK